MKERKSQTSPDLNALQAQIDQLKEELQLSQNQYASILNASPDGIVIASLDTHILKASPAAMKMFGFARKEDVIGKSAAYFVISKERMRVASHIASILQGKKLGLLEYTGLRADKSLLDIEVNAEILRDAKGHPSQFVLIVRDITERKKASIELEKSEAQTQALINAIPDLILTNRRDGEYLAIHAADPSLMVAPPETVLHRKLNEVLPRPLADQCLKAIEDALDLQATQELTYSIPIDGEERHFEARVSPCTEETTITIVRDITERKRAEERLRMSAQLLDSVQEAVVASDMEGRILYWGPGAEKLYGYMAKEVQGKRYRDFAGAIDPPDEEAFRQEVLTAGSWDGEHIQKNRSGKTFWTASFISVVKDEQGQPSGFIGIDQDITERKLAEEALRDSENRYRTLFEAHSDGILIADVETKELLYTNPAVQQIFGYTKEELLTMAVKDLHPKEALPYVIAEFEAQARGEKTLAANLPCVRKDRSVFYADINTSSIPLQGRLCNVGFFRDVTERKEAAQKLQESEERFKQVAETAKEWIWEMDAEGLYTYSNPIVEQILGYKPEDLVGKVYYYELFAPHVREEVQKDAANRAQHKEAFLKRVNPVLHKNGTVVILETTGVPILDPEGHLLGYRGTDTDVTERKQAEEALRQEKAFFSRLFNAQQDTIFLFEPDTGKPIRWNKKFTEISGYSNDEIARMKAPNNFYDATELEKALDYTEKQLKGGDARTELSLITKQGTRIPFEYVATRFEIDGKILLLSIGRDLTERKQAEAALKERETSYFNLFNTVKQAIYIQNPDATFINVNQGALDMYGYKKEDFIGKTPEFLSAPGKNDMSEVARRVDLAFQGHPQKFEFWGKRKDGSIFPKDVWVVKGRYFGKEVLITLAEDITERKQAEKEKDKFETNLQQAQKIESVGRLAGGVAHDFNNMLAVILGRTEMAIEQVEKTLPLYKDLREIQKAGERSADLTRQLLAFARKQTITPQILDLNETVEQMLQMLRRLIGEEIDLQWHPAAECGPVRMDPSQIDQMLANLCVNARDAIGGIGQITIETGLATFDSKDCSGRADCQPGEFVLLSVKDSGQGMDKETQKHIFEPFFTTKGISKGTGLGLATVYGAVRQNEGFIEVSSKPGKGTTFRIYLPRHTGKTPPVKTEKTEPTIQRGEETILLVEDEPAILEVTAKMLKRQGYTVLTADTPGKAIHMAQEQPGDIHLLITDVVMPEMNGRDLAKTILSLYPQIKRLFMSGYTADVIAHQGVLDESVCFIQKPFTQKELLTQVRQALDHSG